MSIASAPSAAVATTAGGQPGAAAGSPSAAAGTGAGNHLTLPGIGAVGIICAVIGLL